MSIIRTSHSKENPFAQLCKQSLWDKNLSLEAVGLWARLISRPDNWQVSATELAKSCGCNIKRIYKILSELIRYGYAVGFQERGNKGRYGSFEYIIYEEPLPEEEVKKIFPLSQFRLSGKPISGKWDTTNIELTKKEKNVCCAEGDKPLSSAAFAKEEPKMEGKIPERFTKLTAKKVEILCDLKEIMHRSLKSKVLWTTDEMLGAWQVLYEYKGFVNDPFRFIEGTLEKIKNKKKSESISKYQKSKKEKSCYDPNFLENERKKHSERATKMHA